MEKLDKNQLAVNEAISKMPWCDCDVIPTAFGSFAIACSDDLTYYHTIEIVFADVLFTYCRYDFHIDTAKGLFVTSEPSKLPITLNQRLLNDGYKLYTIEDEDGAIYCIASKELSISYDSVLRYSRPDLQPNQRIADWI